MTYKGIEYFPGQDLKQCEEGLLLDVLKCLHKSIVKKVERKKEVLRND